MNISAHDLAAMREADERLLASAKEMLAALLYVQKQIESGQELGMGKINEAIRKAQGKSA